MTVSITEDILGGDAEQSAEGYRATRLFKIYAIDTTANAWLLTGLDRPELPAIGAAHPAKPQIVALRKRVQLGASGDAWDLVVRVEYGPPQLLGTGGGLARVGDVTRTLRAELITEETVKDTEGNLMQTRYVSRLAVGLGGSSIGVSTLTHRVSVQRPTYSIVTTRVEADFPYQRARQFSGRTNAGPFRGEPQDQWLLSMEAAERDDGLYDTRYTVTLSEEGWQAKINHNVGGIIPNDIRRGNGEEVRQVYKRANFQVVPL